MTIPSCRTVMLIDARTPDRRVVPALRYRDYPPTKLDHVEALWANAREAAATAGRASGAAPPEHSHWDWRNKIDSVETGRHMLVAVECEGEEQGMMAVLRLPRSSRAGNGRVVYVDYLESAPWNLKGLTASPRFIGVGTVLLADAIRLSVEAGLGGRVGLHSLPQAEPFYGRCGMTNRGPDPEYYDLTYFEYTDRLAVAWLVGVGETI